MADLPFKYNPRLLPEEDLQSNFVVREKELEWLLSIIRDNDTESNQHVLVIGPRGSGKTTLLLRTAMAVKQDKELARRWRPVIFPEESYFVASAGEFWLEALFHLAEQTDSVALKKAYEDLRGENDEERLGERALLRLQEFADAESTKLLLIVENLGMLLGGQIKDDHAWKIRETLSHESRIMLLGSAVSRFDEIDNVDKAMFDFFTIQELPALSDDECDKIWANIAGSPLKGQIRPINILTGGNPRLLTIIARFGMRRSFKDLMTNLVQLVDEHTEYFKSHLDSMAPTERKVYLALADLWEDSTARDIAQAARVDVNTASALLQRLVLRKAVLAEGLKKNRRYAVAERMYNIYHLMRRRGRSANRVKYAVSFMVALYGPEEAAQHIQREMDMLPPDQCDDHHLALEECVQKNSEAERHGHSNEPALMEETARALLKKGVAFSYIGKTEKAIECYEAVIKQYGHSNEPALMEETARALRNKGAALGKMGKREEAIECYDAVIERFGHSNISYMRDQAEWAWIEKCLTATKEAIECCEADIKKYGHSDRPFFMEKTARALNYKGHALDKMGKREEAIECYEAVIEQYGHSQEPALMEETAWARVYKGASLARMGNNEESIGCYEAVIEQYRHSQEPAKARLMAAKAWALLNKGIALGQMGKREEEIGCYDALIEWYGRSQESGLLGLVMMEEQTMRALLNKGIAFSQMGKGAEALHPAKAFLDGKWRISDNIGGAIDLFTMLAAAGQTKEALNMLEDSARASLFEPLIAGLRLHLGRPVTVARELREVAKDVLERIRENEKKIRQRGEEK